MGKRATLGILCIPGIINNQTINNGDGYWWHFMAILGGKPTRFDPKRVSILQRPRFMEALHLSCLECSPVALLPNEPHATSQYFVVGLPLWQVHADVAHDGKCISRVWTLIFACVINRFPHMFMDQSKLVTFANEKEAPDLGSLAG